MAATIRARRARRGLLEKDLVLDVSLRLGKLIEEQLGAEVIYTRTDDTFIPLDRAHCVGEREEGGPVPFDSRQLVARAAYHGRRDVLPEFHRFEGSAGRGVARERELRRSRSSSCATSSRRSAARESGGVEGLRGPHAIVALRVFGAQFSGDEESRREEGAVRGADRRADAVDSGGDRVPEQRRGKRRCCKKPDYRQKLADALFRGVAAYAESLSHFQVARAKE